MHSRRLQIVQTSAGLAVGICCLVLGAMSFLVSFEEYGRIQAGSESFRQLEIISGAVNAVTAERAPANVMIVSDPSDTARIAAMRASRNATDRALDRTDREIQASSDLGGEASYIVDDVEARLRVGRRLIDDFVATPPAHRLAQRFRSAIEEMFEAANVAEILRERFSQKVVRVAPEMSVEVFLTSAVGGLRDQAGRLGSYVVMTQRSGREDAAVEASLRLTAGRLAAGRRILRTLASSFPKGSEVQTALGEIERLYFDRALPFALSTAEGVGTEGALGMADFAIAYAKGLESIDQLRVAVTDSSKRRMVHIADAAAYRATLAGTLTALVCVILTITTVVFRNSLFAPLRKAQQQVIAIAQGDLTQPRVANPVRGEVGEMLAGLDALRDEQRWRRQLEAQQAEMAQKLRLLAETDVLTGLLNRRAVETAGLRAIETLKTAGQGSLAVILFDVDHFKSINDTFGHAAGDDVLRQISREFAPLLRRKDVFARFGGEEFLILMPEVDFAETVGIATRLCQRLPQLVTLPDAERRVTASFGIAVHQAGSGGSGESLVANADRGLYTAKKTGRARVYWHETTTVAKIG